MYAEERQQHILDRARGAGRVEASALAQAVGTAAEIEALGPEVMLA